MTAGLGNIPVLSSEEIAQRRQQIWLTKPRKPELYADVLQVLHEQQGWLKNLKRADVMRANTGWLIEPQKWREGIFASRKLCERSKRVIEALESKGVNVRRRSKISVIGAISEEIETLEIVRSIRIIPSIAARDRKPMVNALRYFMTTHKSSKFFRYAVFTAGELVPEGSALREVIRRLSRRVSKLAHWAKKAFEVEFLFRGIEFTRATAKERDEANTLRILRQDENFIGPHDIPLTRQHGADTVLYHVHCNVVYWPHRKLKAAEWTDFLIGTSAHSDGHWKDNGPISNVDDIVRYCLKSNDLDEATSDEIFWLYQEMQRLKFCQPMGEFAAFFKALEGNGQKIVRVRVGDKGILLPVKKSSRNNDAEIDPENAKEPTTKNPEQHVTNQGTSISSHGRKNVIIGVTMPQWRFMPYAEPLILVQEYDPHPTDSADIERLSEIEDLKYTARLDWDESDAPSPREAYALAKYLIDGAEYASAPDSYRVHLSRPTVQSNTKPNRPSSEIEQSVGEQFHERDILLGLVVADVLKGPDRSAKSVRIALSTTAQQFKLGLGRLPSARDVLMAIWRREQADDVQRKANLAVNMQIIDEMLRAAA